MTGIEDVDITNLKSCVSHEEVVIETFMEDPELAEIMLNDAIADGDIDEIRTIWRRMNEAKSRLAIPEAV